MQCKSQNRSRAGVAVLVEAHAAAACTGCQLQGQAQATQEENAEQGARDDVGLVVSTESAREATFPRAGLCKCCGKRLLRPAPPLRPFGCCAGAAPPVLPFNVLVGVAA